MAELKVVNVDVNKLKIADYNPRVWSEKAISDLEKSIKEFSIVDPILCNSASSRMNIIIGGAFRYTVAKKLGYKSVPVIYLNIPDLEREKALNIRLNKNTGDWDWDLLNKEFQLDDLIDYGFDNEELSDNFIDILDVTDDEFSVEKELKKLKKSNIKLGDIYQLGSHRLLCGNSNDKEAVSRLMDGVRIDMAYCDPIYNQQYDYSKGLGKKDKYGVEVEDNRSDSEYEALIRGSIENILDHSKEDLHIFYYCNPIYIGMIQNIYKSLGIENKRVCLWIKNNQNPTPQVAFNRCYEPVVYGTVNKPYLGNVNNINEILNKDVATGNAGIDDLMSYLDIWLVDRLPTADYLHPTQKSPALHEKPLRRCTKPGDVVVDFFAGSGSTMVACEQLKRKCFMVELDPVFCQLIINRYEKLTGNRAIKVG